jgi:predicted dehydrogenase
MTKLRVGIIGCGPPERITTKRGSRIRPGQGNVHAEAYAAHDDCEVVAAADIKKEHLDLFCETHDVPHGYLSHHEMLAHEDLDIVSVCVWPALHARMVIDSAKAGVRAVHCEKPMAVSFGEATEMVRVCEERDVQLSFHHQRRFGEPYRKARELVKNGAIGDLVRIEAFCINLYDWGSHWFDMMFFYNNDEPVDWVMGQIDARHGRLVFGVPVEGQGLSFFRYRNGVEGLMVTFERQNPYALVGRGDVCGNRLMGTDGTIEVGVADGPTLRLRNEETGGAWRAIEIDGGMHGRAHHVAAIADVVEALQTGREPELSGRRALQATEMIFATYESSRRRARVELPLDVDKSPFVAMVEAGMLPEAVSA